MSSVPTEQDGGQDLIFDTFDDDLDAIHKRIASMGARANGPNFVQIQPTARRLSDVPISNTCSPKWTVIQTLD